MSSDWSHLVGQMHTLLAPSMAKDHPNLPVVKAEGVYYYGLDGKTYLDFTSGIAVANTGHRHPKVVKAIKQAADQLVHGPSGVIMYESILRLAKELTTVLPAGLDCFFFANSGTEAIEGAIKLAKHVTRRPYVLSFLGCFHGRSMGSLSVTTSKSKYRKFLQPSGLSYQLPYARVDEVPPGADPDVYCAEQLEKDVATLFAHQVTPEEVACAIVEPVLGEGGYIVPPKGWLKKLREICDRHGILLIFDEVQTGFGRTGNWFAAQTFEVTPDIMAIAKGIASGLPLSATVASQELMKQWPLGSHGTTFGGNPIACAAALATLEVMKEENLVENARVMGSYAQEQLCRLQQKHPTIGSIRAVGLMIGIEIVDPRTKAPNGEGLLTILNKCLSKGVLFYLCGNRGEVIRMIPPLTVTKEQIDVGLRMLDEAITEYEQEILCIGSSAV
ncbi:MULTISPECIES: aspartate aminotransferase family protein [Bacillales]|jgi:4-aminobutyrate aminotransferase|uniref:(S)-3-amino-2-methylpropionate transaminase n=1 Tax=Brevibacillus aydinogluensis TaxID=927786 RepID=A0AA48MD49_9BACL|nr:MULTISPECIES: aspartate aminotransferase family protein [Bacillales]REK66840.1 MAG: aspartate aminotransferase family protein [Brevibacillus sp.]MBR8658833.1 aspartate aminotransferase family protein [Brevibacillus sp. NL20B1]MDT3416422.1 4-aminobutyrate aminotransferase [Brevibacillus aydinogluensis]NNV02331.1 aspartate aminotransferase family protein [Brevibacillus sp. MCWH]UFJ62745.1 aspartate aminotransferase family protein [Anoxybacillus sediminis]